MKLFPKLKDADFEKAWLKIDSNADGELSLQELAAYYGFNLSPSANRAGKAGDEEMTDEQILEALQLSATLADMQARPRAPTAPPVELAESTHSIDVVAYTRTHAPGHRRSRRSARRRRRRRRRG